MLHLALYCSAQVQLLTGGQLGLAAAAAAATRWCGQVKSSRHGGFVYSTSVVLLERVHSKHRQGFAVGRLPAVGSFMSAAWKRCSSMHLALVPVTAAFKACDIRCRHRDVDTRECHV